MAAGALYRRCRRWAAGLAYRALAPRPGPVERAGRPMVVGFTRSPSGIGESARLCFGALGALGFDPAHHDLSARFQPGGMLPALPPATEPAAATGPVILHANPPEIYAALAHARGQLAGRMAIGYWAWELARAPRTWAAASRFLHEIWVPSAFCAEAMRPLAACPVRVVPQPVAIMPAAAPDRTRFGPLPEDAVVFLAVCDLRSSLARKNPEGAITAFRRAFGDAPDRVLAIKVGGRAGNEAAHARLAAAAGHANVRLIEGTLAPEAMAGLIAGCDAVVSLHRAEGFGLLPAQAMLAGRPVIATDWSGTRDFLGSEWAALVPARMVPVTDPQGIYGGDLGEWADPDLDAAAAAMALLAGSASLRARMGAAGRRAALAAFSPEAWWHAAGPAFHAACGALAIDRHQAVG